MLCLECGAEMRLVQVIKDTTMLVAGYEHQTWQCSGCSTVERRRTFNRETPRPAADPNCAARIGPNSVDGTNRNSARAAKPSNSSRIHPTSVSKFADQMD
jgi:hypothetical protein